MTESFRVTDYSKGGFHASIEDILREVAVARGVAPADQKVFWDALPAVPNPIRLLPEYQVALERLSLAIAKGEAITIFGDYDVDGVTSLVQMLDLLRAAGHRNLRLYIPDRITEDYGLTREAVDNCVATQNPQVIFTVDCGSASTEVLEYLRGRGVDTIVLDHHHVPEFDGKHPSFAHLNPRGFIAQLTDATRPLLQMSAAGLTFLFSEAFASDTAISGWSRDRALILAGLGTLVDVMPVNNLINRALVKNSIHLANGPALGELPGLQLLKEACAVKRFDSFAYGFIIGPHLNAAGRLATAQTAARVLGARTTESAAPYVPELIANNKERRAMQETILAEAEEMAELLLIANPRLKILLLAKPEWHPGVVGIVAARIKERFRRPTFVCGEAGEGLLKGSGRSIPGVNLGELVTKAREAGLLVGGGGHAMAAGIKFQPERFVEILDWLHQATEHIEIDPVDHFEVLGPAELFPASVWLDALGRLEPFGNANERLRLLASDAVLVEGPRPLTKSGGEEVWAWAATFELPNGARIRALWKSIDAASKTWSHGRRYRMALSLTRTPGRNGGFYENWHVEGCDHVAGNATATAA